VISDSVGCSLVATYNYVTGNDIGFSLTANPNHGLFSVKFYLTETASANLRVVDLNGKTLYTSDNPNFKGSFSREINLGRISAGMYVLQLRVGSKNYVQKFMVY